MHVFCGDAQMRLAQFFPLFREARQTQAALFKAEVEHLVQFGVRLQQSIFADDADIRHAVLDVGGHIGGLDEEKAELLIRRLQNQLARLLFEDFRADAAADEGIRAHSAASLPLARATLTTPVSRTADARASRARRARIMPMANPTAERSRPNWAHSPSYRPPERTGAPTPAARPVKTIPE